MINPEAVTDEVIRFLWNHREADTEKLALVGSLPDFSGIGKPELLSQIKARQKVKLKLPQIYLQPNFIFPPLPNLEQCSSELTAQYKVDIIAKTAGSGIAADLCGGLGIDTLALASVFKSVCHLEPNRDLQAIAAHNFNALGHNHITSQHTDALRFLTSLGPDAHFDLFYLDPARRDTNQKRVFGFADCYPNIADLAALLVRHSEYQLIKASPMMDISEGLKQLQSFGLKPCHVYVVAVSNDCKELLFMCGPSETTEPAITCTNFSTNARQDYSFYKTQEETINNTFMEPMQYLYEPNVALLKAGAFKSVAGSFGLFKLALNSHLYTSDKKVAYFPGRVFYIEQVLRAGSSNLKQEIRLLVPEGKANLSLRNFPGSAEGIKKAMRLQDGGEVYLFGTTGAHGEKLLIRCKKEKN
jgi:THUMP domain-like